ncbi:hypothetical protein DY000_02040516 [Brassica cretica]|uniref:DDT domain-containing protein n=1 Tax=Brassica cretica TaxID=69181 RepID=A0ABQ7BN65_BRACR|nr:hypothetical protein DY000_02040516 [Brassica cretica]
MRSDAVGNCVTKKGATTCVLKYCPKCLLTRYGEIGEEVAVNDNWVCPKCRKICNCSWCRYQELEKPTTETTISHHYRSKVQNFSKMRVESIKARKKGEEPFDNAGNMNSPKNKPVRALAQRMPLRRGYQELQRLIGRGGVGEEGREGGGGEATETAAILVVEVSKSNRISPLGREREMREMRERQRRRVIMVTHATMRRAFQALHKRRKPTGKLTATAKKNGCSNVSEFLKKEGSEKYFYRRKGNCAEEINDSSAGCSEENAAARTKPVLKEKEEFQLEEVKLPQGIESITVSSVDLHPENAGSVLQFLEFCLTFREALGLRDGQAHLVVREVLSGSQEHSTLTQTIIQLLTLILVDRGDISVGLSATDDRWFTILGNCLAESEVKLDDFPPEMFQKGISEYEEMDSLQKLKLLNFVCDEALGISVMRNFIENPEYVEKKKKAEEKLNAAEAREKQLYQKIKNDFAKAEADNNGVALTIEQRLAIISQMSAESEENQFPVELDDNDLILWNLKSYNEEPTILLQDLGSCSDICPHEKWYSFSSEQKPQVEKYITFKRKKCRLEKKMEKKEKRRKSIFQ